MRVLLFQKANALLQVQLALITTIQKAPPLSLAGREVLLNLHCSSFR